MPGSKVAAAESLLILKPMLSPERDVPTPAEQVQMTGAKANLMTALVTAQGEVQRSISEIEGLTIARDRAEKLLADRAGSRRAFDDADAQLNIANSVLAAAKQREKELNALLKSLDTSNETGVSEPASPLTLTAPIGGIVRSINVSEGQTVATGAPLFEVVNLDTIWIRVPVYVDLLTTLKSDQDANLVSLGGKSLSSSANQSNSSPTVAKPIAAPPTADAASSSADLYYEVDNREIGLRPGQRIGVDVPMTSITEALVVPTAAVLYDIYGGTWVYVEADESKYMRHRVLLEWVDGDDAILSDGPAEGTKVVVDGAAELFGTEFGAGK
ncbi:efflux RND transporter periplasmic adaptor subunit [Stieleria magnilauensis]|uniref:Multidrug efflux system subunit MdtA n=1 Tax=Stieleria magnilauensis TaxID=2527963 RepID=A0ABX5XWC9_9BACT|nr:multidrug efflux system subunit MdtA [Planctomycetes bacterium TBK1r]